MKREILVTVLILVLCGTVYGNSYNTSISWIHGEERPEFGRSPEEPTASDLIYFTIPTSVYNNSWTAEQTLGGIPMLSVDPDDRIVELWFQPPPPGGEPPSTFNPVCGLEGYFGPLEEGTWVFFSHFPGSIYLDSLDIASAPTSPTISGYVRTEDSSGINNVTLTFNNGGGSTTTNSSGYYSMSLPDGWSGIAMPSKSDYDFIPTYRIYANVTTNMPNENYIGIGTVTPPPPLPPPPTTGDYFTEQFFFPVNDGFDLSYKSITFIPTIDGTSYSAYLEEITQLPTNPTGGIELALGDDDSQFVSLSNQATVSIYGSSFPSFYVGSNGYITFTEGDNNYSETLSNHFNTLRISALFNDLNPSAGGHVSWKQLADRAAVTWENVPEYSGNNASTFQIEMYFDGRIRLSWLVVENNRSIVGLSGGFGLPEDFEETDLSEIESPIEPPPPPPPPPPPTTELRYITEQFFSGDDIFDLSNKSIMFTPAIDGTSYSAYLQDITQLPTQPTGGIELTLGDDNNKPISLINQATVSIYGSSFASFYVGSNGYITFTEGDNDYSETLSDHFDTLRISALFNDLNPSAGGHVRWIQLADRVVVTWQNVPEYSGSNSNTFQVEMYFDGRIQISWLLIETDSGIVGLSGGLGMPEDFQETDLSEINTQPPPTTELVYITEQFSSPDDIFDMSNKSIMLTPTSDGSAYSAYIEEITQLPTEPTDGTELALGDDDSQFVKLNGESLVSIYGITFGNFYAGSNGYITFSEADNDHSETLSDHFDTLRISALFEDLDPSAGGQVSWKQLADRAVVTWENIPEYGKGNSNTFQVEMYFDGRIQISWLVVETETGIVGLSDGLGLPTDFEETNLSELSATQKPPPSTALDFVVEQFFSISDSFDLSNTSIMFTPSEDGASYSAYLQEISQLPTAPSTGTTLMLGDDDYKSVSLINQATVSIYGNSFGSFYVGSNGYITFTEGDNDYSETLPNHFDTLRISVLFGDFNPSVYGMIRWVQLTDRAVVTWDSIPEYNKTNLNTFQVEMYFDGRIQLSWLNIQANDGIVGLSEGLGVPEGFQETDLSEISGPIVLPETLIYIAERFSVDDVFDLSNKSITFTPTSDSTSYSGQLHEISQLPSNRIGGRTLTLSDDDFRSISLSDDATVSIFGNSFSSCYVGSNGYITFTAGDRYYSDSENLSNHFDTLRISALFNDLNPSEDGRVSWKQWEDRVAVTWLDVPTYGDGNHNTFQVEMYFDGRIQISWLQIECDSCTVGLSNGLGVPEDFEEIDLSAY